MHAPLGGIRRNSQLLHSVKVKKRKEKTIWGILLQHPNSGKTQKKRKRKKKKWRNAPARSPLHPREVEKIKKKCAEIPQLDPWFR